MVSCTYEYSKTIQFFANWNFTGFTPQVTVQIYRQFEGQAETLLNSFAVVGNYIPISGSASSGEPASMDAIMTGSITFSDPDSPSATRTYRAVLVNRQVAVGGITQQEIQRLTITSVET